MDLQRLSLIQIAIYPGMLKSKMKPPMGYIQILLNFMLSTESSPLALHISKISGDTAADHKTCNLELPLLLSHRLRLKLVRGIVC